MKGNITKEEREIFETCWAIRCAFRYKFKSEDEFIRWATFAGGELFTCLSVDAYTVFLRRSVKSWMELEKHHIERGYKS